MSTTLFEGLCRKYVQQHGKDSLIPPISQDSSRECEMFNVVEKRTRKLIFTSHIEYNVKDLKIFDILDQQMEDIACREVEAGECVFNSEDEQSLSFVARWAKRLVGLFNSFSHTHTTNVNVVAVDIKNIHDFTKKLTNRKIKLTEQCIVDMRNDNSVVCVIIGVRKTKDVVEITRTDGQKGTMSSDVEEVHAKIDANISGKTKTWSRLPQNTVLAYKVLELQITLGSGAIEPRWIHIDGPGFVNQLERAGVSGMPQGSQGPLGVHIGLQLDTMVDINSYGREIKLANVGFHLPKLSVIDTADSNQEFFTTTDVETQKEQEVLDSCHMQDQLEPLRQNLPEDKLNTIQQCVKTRQDLSPEFRHIQDQLEPLLHHLLEENIKSSLLKLMACHNDLVLFSNMLDSAKRGPLREEKKIYQQSANTDTLFKIMDLAGFKIENEDIVYEEKKPTKMLRAVAYIVATMCDVDEKILVKISQCSAEQFKALEKIFRTVISSKMKAVVTIDNEIKPALERPAKDILTEMDFGLRFYSWTIQPPKTHTEVHECIYCILYCFS